MGHTLSTDQKAEQTKAVCRAIDRICDAWGDAREAAAARGYPTQSPGPSEAPALRSPHDPADPLHTRTMSPASGGKGSAGDGGMVAAISRPDAAGQWLNAARRHLAVLLWFSTADERGEQRWRGDFHPPSLRQNLKRAAGELIEMWPKNVDRLLAKIVALANFAGQEWPPTPEAGKTVDGVKVGERGNTAELCAECGKVIGGGAADPLRRDPDGQTYHKSPCYETVRKRRQRKGAAA